MQSLSTIRTQIAAAASALALSLVLIAGTVMPSNAQAVTTYVGNVA